MKIILPILLCLALLALSCDDNATGTNVIISYSLTKGNQWNYAVTFRFMNLRYTGSFQPLPPPDQHLTSEVIVGDSVMLGDTLRCIRVTATERDSVGNQWVAEMYYVLDRLALRQVAYKSSNLSLPKRYSGFVIEVAGRTFSSFEELRWAIAGDLPVPQTAIVDSIIYEPERPIVWEFPLAPGKSWTYRREGNPFYIGKSVSGLEVSNSPWGSVVTPRVTWKWDINNDGTIDTSLDGYELVTSRGMLRRTITVKDLALTDISSSTVIAYFDIQEEHLLTSATIH